MHLLYDSDQTNAGSVAFYYKTGSGMFCHNYENLRIEDAHTGFGYESERSFTVTIASPAVFTQTGHGYVAGDKLRFSTTGALPTGLTAGTYYYVISAGLGTDTFQVSATEGGSAVNTSGSQSGTHNIQLSQAIWGSQWRNIAMGDLYYSAWDLVADNPVGQPMNAWYDIRVLNYNRDATGPMFNITAMNECAMTNMDLEGWRDTIMLISGGSDVVINGLHMENNDYDAAFSKNFIVSNGSLTVNAWSCQGNATTANNSDQCAIFHLDSGGNLVLGPGVHSVDTTLGTQYITEVVYATTGNGSKVTILGEIQKNGGGLNSPGVTAGISESIVDGYRALTYGTTIATDLSEPSSKFGITATNGTAFTISNPTNATYGRRFTYLVFNNSGGVMGDVTWGGDFELNSPFEKPANGAYHAITFVYNGSKHVEESRSGRTHKGELYVNAAGMWTSTTSGAAANAKREETTNDVNYYTVDFDPTTQEFAEANVLMPSDWDGGTFTAQFVWTASGTSTNSVVWGCRARSFGDLETLDQAFGTEVTVTDAHSATAFQMQKSPVSGAITAAGTPAAGELLALKFARLPADGSDTLAVDAMLMGVLITYTRL
jgi:hypothetical protein